MYGPPREILSFRLPGRSGGMALALSRAQKVTIVAAWSLLPATVAVFAYMFWRNGLDLPRNGLRARIFMNDTHLPLLVVFMFAVGVTVLTVLVGGRKPPAA